MSLSFNDIYKKTIQILLELFQIKSDSVRLETKVSSLINSIQMIKFVVEIEKSFNVFVEEDFYERKEDIDIAYLVEYINQKIDT